MSCMCLCSHYFLDIKLSSFVPQQSYVIHSRGSSFSDFSSYFICFFLFFFLSLFCSVISVTNRIWRFNLSHKIYKVSDFGYRGSILTISWDQGVKGVGLRKGTYFGISILIYSFLNVYISVSFANYHIV